MNEGRRNFLKAVAGAGAASLGAEATLAGNKREQIHDIDKPFVNMSFAEFGDHMQNLPSDMQVTAWPATLSSGETVLHVITEPRSSHPLPEKWRDHEIGSGHYPNPEKNDARS